MTEWILYLDESGSTDPHQIPVLKGQTPVFTLAGLTLPCDRWREFDREYLYLKREFFRKETSQSTQLDTGWEAKGNYLLAPRNSASERNRVFVERVIAMIARYDGRVMGVSFVKSVRQPMPRASMYTKAFQIIAERYNSFLREKNSSGLIIADSRMAHLKKGGGLDYTVAISYLSYIFGNVEGRLLTKIMEAPLFADSKLTMGLQIADIIAMLVYTNAYRTKISPYCKREDGFEDYSHTSHYYPLLQKVIYESIAADSAGGKMFGLRNIDHRTR